MKSNSFPFLTTCLLLGLLSGCAVGPDYQKPEPALPSGYSEGEPDSTRFDWWDRFGDETLGRLLQSTMENNYSLEAGRQRILKARGVLEAVRGTNLPQLGINASVIRQERSENSLFPVLENNPDFPERTETLYHASFDASWEIDIFGGNRNRIKIGELQVDRADLALRDLQASLLAETGRLYITYLVFTEQLQFLEESIIINQKLQDVVNARFKAGTVSELDVAQARARLNQWQARKPGLQAEQEAVLQGLSILTLLSAEELNELLEDKMSIPEVESFLGDRIDSMALQNRPDVRIAENSIQQANAELGIQISNLYPRFTLVGSLGLESIEVDTFTTSASRLWRLGPTITLPVFEGGTLRNRAKAAEAELKLRIAEYKQLVWQALSETEAAMIRFNHGIDESNYSRQAWESTASACSKAENQYDAGILPLDRLLFLQAEQLAARDRLTQSRGQSALNLIALSKSLGGGWDFGQ